MNLATRIKFALWCKRRHNWLPYAYGWSRSMCWACENLPPLPEMVESRSADVARWAARRNEATR